MTAIRTLAAVLLAACTLPACAADFSTPENAIRALETAYIRKDIEAAVAAKDFHAEAQLMLLKVKPAYANDPQLLKQTADVLELAFRKEIQENGYPDFASLKCTLGRAAPVSPNLVKLTETCLFPDGGKSVDELHVFKGKRGWRMVNVPE